MADMTDEARVPDREAALAVLAEALHALYDQGYQPQYNGRPSCPFCRNFIDDEETHAAGCPLAALEARGWHPSRSVPDEDGLPLDEERLAKVLWDLHDDGYGADDNGVAWLWRSKRGPFRASVKFARAILEGLRGSEARRPEAWEVEAAIDYGMDHSDDPPDDPELLAALRSSLPPPNPSLMGTVTKGRTDEGALVELVAKRQVEAKKRLDRALDEAERRFWKDEAGWAKAGSGQTPDQQTGAHMVWSWLKGGGLATIAPVIDAMFGGTEVLDGPDAALAVSATPEAPGTARHAGRVAAETWQRAGSILAAATEGGEPEPPRKALAAFIDWYDDPSRPVLELNSRAAANALRSIIGWGRALRSEASDLSDAGVDE